MKINGIRISHCLLTAVIGILLAVNCYLFVIPNGFAPAGINGIAVMVQYKFGFSIGYLSLIINVPLCIMAYFLIEKRYAIYTMIFCLSYSFFFLFLQDSSLLSAFQYDAGNMDTIYPVILAGIISGFFNNRLLRIDSCSGGTDIIARYVAKRNPRLNFFWITFILNAAVAAASYFVYAKKIDGQMVYDMKPVCLCLVNCFTSSFVGTELTKKAKSAFEFIVVTDSPDEIEEEIIKTFHHSATRLNGRGVYTKTDKSVLLCTVNKNQVYDFVKALEKYPGTFAAELMVADIVGNYRYRITGGK